MVQFKDGSHRGVLFLDGADDYIKFKDVIFMFEKHMNIQTFTKRQLLLYSRSREFCH